jgi:hypothetical protein
VFDLERALDRLYDEVYPPAPPAFRKAGLPRNVRPILCKTMGCLVSQDNRRELFEERSYYRIDLDDFMEYATTTLAPQVTIDDFPEGVPAFYEFMRGEGEGNLLGEIYGSPAKVWPVDAAITRSFPFLSITARFLCLTGDEIDLCQHHVHEPKNHLCVTLFFATKLGKLVTAPDEKHRLAEWDRYAFYPPCEDDPQWRFAWVEGVCTDVVTSEILNDKSCPKGFKQLAEKIRDQMAESAPKFQLQFELARLMLSLPAYVAFMYDLVTEEKLKVRPPEPAGRRLPKRRRIRPGPIYRIIRSIRVIRPKIEQAPVVQWRSPPRLHAVRGHWRTLLNPETLGKSEEGAKVKGKTWVRDHQRGKLGDLITETELRPSNVVINIKQTLRYAQDVIQSARVPAIATDDSVTLPGDLSRGKPSDEWIAEERAKLSAGLRWLILKRDGFRCQCCGVSMIENNYVRLEVDHKVPVSAWGRTEPFNLWTLCTKCNKGKSNRQ